MAVVERVEAAPGERRRLRLANPATLEPLGELEIDDRRARARRGRARAQGAARVGARRASASARTISSAPRACSPRAPDEFVGADRRRDRQAARRAAHHRDPRPACDSLPVLRQARAPHPRRPHASRCTCSRPRSCASRYRAARRGRDHHAVELPVHPRAESDRAGADRGQRGRAEAVGGRRPTRAGSSRSCWAAAGLPGGRVQAACRATARPGAALLEAGVDKISFTGSVATGRRVAEACGRALIPCTLELGGKDPMIVCDDADLERAARGAVYGAFCNAGQVCTSTERVYVVDRVADEFTRRWSSRPASCARAPTASSTSGR